MNKDSEGPDGPSQGQHCFFQLSHSQARGGAGKMSTPSYPPDPSSRNKSTIKRLLVSLRHIKRINYKVKLKEKINFRNTRGYFFFLEMREETVIFVFILGAQAGSSPVNNLAIRTRFVIKRSVTWKASAPLPELLSNDGAIKLRLL